MNDFKGDTVTMKIRMSELVKDSVSEQYVINQSTTTSPFSSCFKDGVLSIDTFKQALRQTEPTTETKPVTEVQPAPENPLYTFVIMEVDTLGGELETKVRFYNVGDISETNAKKRVLELRKGKCRPTTLTAIYKTKAVVLRKPYCVAVLSMLHLLSEPGFLEE